MGKLSAKDNMKKIHLLSTITLALLLVGCGGDVAKAMKAFGESCQGTVTAELHASQWGNDLTLKCDKFTVVDKK